MRVLLFTGKGGVGKTTLAASTAVRLAEDGRKTLVVSTDPAHSLADTLDVRVSGQPCEVDEGLHAAQIDTRSLLDACWADLRQHLGTVLAGAGVDEVAAEQLTVLPGIEELLALAEVHRLATTGPWETVVVDSGPTADTLRLLALPEAFAGYLEKLFPTHRRVVRGLLAGLAGNGSVERWDAVAEAVDRLQQRLDGLRAMLCDPRLTTVRLVCSPERVVAAETRRILTALVLQGVHVDGLIANRLVPGVGSARGPAAAWLRARRAEQQAVLAELADSIALTVRTIGHVAEEPVGRAALLAIAGELYGEADPLDGPAELLLMSVEGDGRSVDSEYRLRLSLPLAAETQIDLARVGEELAVTVDGRRRLVSLPSVLRRCTVTGATAGADGLTVRFRPDPRLWMR